MNQTQVQSVHVFFVVFWLIFFWDEQQQKTWDIFWPQDFSLFRQCRENGWSSSKKYGDPKVLSLLATRRFRLNRLLCGTRLKTKKRNRGAVAEDGTFASCVAGRPTEVLEERNYAESHRLSLLETQSQQTGTQNTNPGAVVFFQHGVCGDSEFDSHPEWQFFYWVWLLKMGLSENRVYSQWNSHLIGIMISKTIGFRGTLFSDTPKWI